MLAESSLCNNVDEFIVIVCTGSWKMTTSGVTNDENFVKMATYLFRCMYTVIILTVSKC